VDGEGQTGLAAVARDESVDLLVGRAALEPPLDGETEHRDRRGGTLGVDRPHAVVTELATRSACALDRPRELARDMQREDPFVAGELVVGGEKVAGRRLRGRGRLRSGAQARVELLRRELDVVAEALVAEPHV